MIEATRAPEACSRRAGSALTALCTWAAAGAMQKAGYGARGVRAGGGVSIATAPSRAATYLQGESVDEAARVLEARAYALIGEARGRPT